jgi:hypothetical protein
MKTLKLTALGAAAAGVALALAFTAAPLIAQPQNARAHRGPGDGPPAFEHRGEFERGPGGPGGPGFMGPGGPGGPGPLGLVTESLIRFWDREEAVERLELTASQVELLQQSYDHSKPIVEENMRLIHESGKVLGDNLRPDGEPDLDAVNKAIDDLTTAQNAAMKAAAAHRATVQTLLLPEQLDTLKDMRRQHMRRQHMRRHTVDMRGKVMELRNAVRRIAEDGVFSPEERAKVEERLADAPEPFRERVLGFIDKAVARVAAGEEIGNIEDELMPPPEAPRSPRALPPLPPDDVRGNDGERPRRSR